MEIFRESLLMKQRAKEQGISNPSKGWAQAVEDCMALYKEKSAWENSV